MIAKAGLPMARLMPLDRPPERPKRRLGILAGQGYWVGDDFDDPLPPDIQDAFEGKLL